MKNILCKSTHLTIKRVSDIPDGGLKKSITVNMLTFQPNQTLTKNLKSNESIDMVGTYGLNPWNIFNPFGQNTNIMWLMMYNQGLLKDVNAEIVNQRGSFMVAVNNPTIGLPYVIFYNSVTEAAVLPISGKRFNLSEGESITWLSDDGVRVSVTRNNDSDYKEFLITI